VTLDREGLMPCHEGRMAPTILAYPGEPV